MSERCMDYDAYFTSALSRLRDERHYRVFADLERIAGRFPCAICHSSVRGSVSTAETRAPARASANAS
jgi:hypothetical protein